MKKILLALPVMAVLFANCKSKNDVAITIDCSQVKYSTVIAPLVTSKCGGSSCHGSGSHNGDYTTYANLYAIYKNGALKSQVITNKSMPRNSSLSNTELQQFQCWINNSAPNN